MNRATIRTKWGTEMRPAVRIIRRSGAVVVGFAAALLAFAGVASARPEPGIVVWVGRSITQKYPALDGAPPPQASLGGEYTPGPQLCDGPPAGALCDAIPVRLEMPASTSGHEMMLIITLSWNPGTAGNNVMGDALFDARHEQATYPQEVGNNPDGPVRTGGSEEPGTATIRYADPSTTRYDLVVQNLTGANTGYVVSARLELVDDPGMPSANPSATKAPDSGSRHSALNGPGDFPGGGGTIVPPGNGGSLTAQGGPLTELQLLRTAAHHSGGGTDWAPLVVAVILVVMLVATGLRYRRRLSELSGWLSRLSLFWKLLVPFVAVILVIGPLGAYFTVRYLAGRAQTTLDQNLLQRSVATTTYLRDRELYLLEADRFAANLEGVPEATAAGNGAELAQALASAVAVRKDLDVLAATEPSGTGLVDYSRQPDGTFTAHSGVQWSAAPAVRDVLAGVVDATGDKRTSFVRLGDGTVLFLTAGPIRTEHVVGAVVAGVSAARLAEGAAHQAGAAVALYDSSGAEMGASAGSGLPVELAPGLSRGTVRDRTHGHITLYEPFVVRGLTVGRVATRIPVGSAYASVRGAALRLGLLVALAMAAIVAFGTMVTRHILASVEPLVETNRALGRGDLSVRAPVRSGDELGELAQGFNLMAEQLQASYEELERRVAERTEELSRLYQENVKASDARSQFFATISHEFRTPLFAILANTELLRDPSLRPETPEEADDYLETVEQSARLLLDRINEILELARAEATPIELKAEPIAPGALWADIAPSISALARGNSVSFSTDVPADLPPAQADADRLRQVLLNLTSNAIKYTPAGGEVTVTARATGEAVQFAIADTGPGIPKSIGDKVFEPYYRVQGTRTSYASTGLGLALTKRLVEAHSGRIWFENRKGGGTTFYFTLPLVATNGNGAKAPRRRALKGA